MGTISNTINFAPDGTFVLLGVQIPCSLKSSITSTAPQCLFGLSAFVFRISINPESEGGVKMALSSDYFVTIIETVESS